MHHNLWLETPLIFSSRLSSLLDSNVYLKLENLQPSQSFKYRGISHFASHCKSENGPNSHLVIASGGNAGLAAACAAKQLNLRCTVYLPQGATQQMLHSLKEQGAEVVVAGNCYLQALQEAEKAVATAKHAVMVPAYDDPLVWEGHASMIEEISRQINTKPDAIFCSVGGGGLLGGVIIGCKSVGWDDVPLVALETHGSACFYHSMSVNRGRWNDKDEPSDKFWKAVDEKHNVNIAHVRSITSKASSLGATSPAAGVVRMALDRPGGIRCATIPDEMSMKSACLFAEDHKLIVELACSTTLAAAYHPLLFSCLLRRRSEDIGTIQSKTTVVMIVCGGVKISLDELREYGESIQKAALNDCKECAVCCDGEEWKIPM